jgi:hypothetical protein
MNEFLVKLMILSKPNKYARWYAVIVTQGLLRGEIVEGRTERHHILPRSFKMGGEKAKGNIVILTPREHFICHALLIRMVSGHLLYKMGRAFKMMKADPHGDRYFNARLYEAARGLFKHTEETKRKLSHIKTGVRMSPEAVANMSVSQKMRHLINPLSQASREKLRIKNIGANNPAAKSVTIEGVLYGARQEAKRVLDISLKNIDKIARGECDTIAEASKRKSTKSNKPRGGNSTKRQPCVIGGITYPSKRAAKRFCTAS